MSGKSRHVERSRRSHFSNKNFRQFSLNAQVKKEEKEKIKFGEMFTEALANLAEKRNDKEYTVTSTNE